MKRRAISEVDRPMKHYLVLSVLVITQVLGHVSCQSNREGDAPKSGGKDSIATAPKQQDNLALEEKGNAPMAPSSEKSLATKATLVAVKEALLMPDDYLTTLMTLVTATGDTLVFSDAPSGLEKIIGEEVEVRYQWRQGEQWLLCFDCTSYAEEVHLYDRTAVPSKVRFVDMQLEQYTPDPYVEPAATFLMRQKNGNTGTFRSLDGELFKDSTAMKEAFFTYGVVTALYPELTDNTAPEQWLEAKH